MFIETQPTEDPARLKFLPGRQVLAEGTLEFKDETEASVSPLAETLFAIPGVAGVSFGEYSITVSKSGGDWRHLKPAILGSIIEHFMLGAPILRQNASTGSARPAPSATNTDSDDVAAIMEALRRVIDPELGYNIVDLGLVYDVVMEDGGVVHITMTTTTPGCPATNYLKQGAGEAASDVPGVEFVDVNLTYEPRWTPEMMSPDAKAFFGI